MKVREVLRLVPALEQSDPDSVVVIEAYSDSIILVNARPGLHQPIDDGDRLASLAFTALDSSFLHMLGITA